MNCKKYLDLIEDLVEGELSESIAARVNLHVFACRNCRLHCENLKREKEIYAHYLFDREPPADLWTRFQTKLEAEENKAAAAAPIVEPAPSWKGNLFSFPGWYGLFAGAAATILIFAGLIKFFTFSGATGNENYVVEVEPAALRPAASVRAQAKEPPATEPENRLPAISLKNAKGVAALETKPKKAGSIARTGASETVKETKRTFREVGKKVLTDKQIPLKEDERLLAVYAKNLEIEAARQIEKIELLLRSFRNARAASTGGTGKFDVAYEKQQARRLLIENIRLRRNAESYGTRYTEEILGRVEPYLLDISNLETDADPEKVLDIKERVKNQSIIASLQVY